MGWWIPLWNSSANWWEINIRDNLKLAWYDARKWLDSSRAESRSIEGAAVQLSDVYGKRCARWQPSNTNSRFVVPPQIRQTRSIYIPIVILGQTKTMVQLVYDNTTRLRSVSLQVARQYQYKNCFSWFNRRYEWSIIHIGDGRFPSTEEC